MSTSTFQIDTHFDNKPPLEHQLMSEIEASPDVTRTVQNVRRKGNDIMIDFDAPIGTEYASLVALLTSHKKESQARVTVTSTPKIDSSRSSNYTRVLVWVYKGAKRMGTIVSVDCVSYIDNGGTGYSIEVFDRTNNQCIAKGSFTNNDEESVSLTTYEDNVPDEKARIEVSIKRDGGPNRDIYILGITFGLR